MQNLFKNATCFIKIPCMKKLLFWGLMAITIQLSSQSPAYFLSDPCLTPDGQTVIFSFEGDLWASPVRSGRAERLTAMEGYETNPRVSPDGKWIAFTGTQSGNSDVYVMPMGGGEIRQLTYHSSGDIVSSWSWDSKSIYFTSNRYSRMAGYKVPVNGGTPVSIFGDFYFQYDHDLWEHPSSGEIFYDDTWESSNQAQRKRYKGPFNPDIQSYNLKTRQHKKYTDWIGKDFSATIDRNGNLYFISDEANGEFNLYTFVGGKKTALTRFNSSIKSPVVNAQGGKVVFEKDYQLWLYDVASKKADRLNISMYRNYVLPKERDFDVKGKIEAFDVSPDGKKLAFVSRGELFVSDTEGKFVKQIKRGSAERVREVKWLSDNRTLVFSQTLNGYTNWYTMAADSSDGLKELTADRKNNRAMALNKKRTKAVYLSGRDEVRLMDLKTMKSETIIKDEIWGIQSSDPGFSPNDEYVVFSAYRNFEREVLAYHLVKKKTINLTNSGVTEADPLWSPDGKYIYFVSQRLKPAYPFGMPDAKVYRMSLEKLDDPYRMDNYEKLFREENKDSTKKESEEKDSTSKEETKPITIDTDRIMERLETVGPSFGRQGLVTILQKGEKTFVLILSNHDEGKTGLFKVTYEPFEKTKTEKISGAESGNISFATGGDKYFLLVGGNISKLNLDGNKAEPVDISFTFRRNLSAEFNQIFFEAWAQMEENYYDEKFHGLDWNKTRDYYKQFIPFINNRADLRVMLNDMLGELNSSHQGFGSAGDEEKITLSSRTMETGILFQNDDPYKVKKVLHRSSADNKDMAVQEGDVLLSVNDEPVDQAKNRNAYFTRPSLDNELKLAFSRNGQTIDVKVHPQSSLQANFYDEWIDVNQQRVNEKGNGRIAYGYMKNMGQGELQQFIIDMTRELNGKEALIFDIRYNTGGNVHDEVLNFLSQRSYLKWKYRQGKLTAQSNFAPSDIPIILLINEQSLSDAEMTTAGFKALELGTVIGNETYHWIIFTSGVGMVDGSFIRMPAWGCYSKDGQDLEKTGVKPDILVINSFDDKLNGRDPQLDRAIEEALKRMK